MFFVIAFIIMFNIGVAVALLQSIKDYLDDLKEAKRRAELNGDLFYEPSVGFFDSLIDSAIMFCVVVVLDAWFVYENYWV